MSDTFSPTSTAVTTPMGASAAPEQLQTEAPEAPMEAEAQAQDVATQPAEDAPPDKWAKHFEKLSRRDLELRQKERELKAHAEAVKRATRFEDLAKSDKLALLKELNISVDDVLRSHLNNGRQDPADEIASLRQEIADLRNQNNETRTNIDLMDAGNRWDREFHGVFASPEYDIIRDWEGEEAVDKIQNYVANYYHQTKKLLRPKEVLDMMRNNLQSNLKRVTKYTQKDLPEVKAPSQPKASTTTGPKTLTPKTESVMRHRPFLTEHEEMMAIADKYR